MRLIRQAHEFEYRDAAGIDRFGQADVWQTGSGERAVLVLRGLDRCAGSDVMLQAQAREALGYLAHSWLPFLVPDAQLDVLILRRTGAPSEDSPALKVRALLLA
ncbi:hypothetical protein [Deinococcus alpinitundrae]|uniref:hypothetical protein n=1 Tax=Deinococcus alpinitundrae TaxID=468913 RepID=UPI00137B0816|nr:hypothetical protein [Deinococcus alpinitundrae]